MAKPFLPLGGRPILMHAVQAVQACPLVHHIVVVVAQTHVAETHQLVVRYDCRKVSKVATGGRERQDSVLVGLSHIDGADLVVVHDGVRSASGWRVTHVDTVVLAQAPRIAPYVGQMRQRLAAVPGLDPTEVSIKATTPEGMGAIGREEGIAAHAVATLEKR